MRHTDTDTFEAGQWLKGRVYENKCDLSSDGKLIIYFVHKGNNWRLHPDYGFAWTAISKPPYFTALALWPENGTWGGGGYFIDAKTVRIYVSKDSYHPNHPPRGLTILDSDTKVVLNAERRVQVGRSRWDVVHQGRDVQESYKALWSSLNEDTFQTQLDVDGDWYQLLDMEMAGKSRDPWLVKLNPPTIWRKQYSNYTIEKHYFGYRQNLHDVIYDQLCLGDVRDDSRREYLRIMDDFTAQGAQGVILGCTEITLLIKPEHTPIRLYDTTLLHALAAVDWSLAN